MKTRYNPTDKIFTKRWGGLILLALLVLSALCCFVSGVAWLGWILSLLVLLLFGYRALQKRFKATKWWKILNSFFMVLAVFGVAIFLRLFVFEVYEIPSESMENTLVPGDKIVVNKLSIGPRMPRSPFEIPWVNLLFYTSKEARTRIDSTWWAPRRLKGFHRSGETMYLYFKTNRLDLIFLSSGVWRSPAMSFKLLTAIFLLTDSMLKPIICPT